MSVPPAGREFLKSDSDSRVEVEVEVNSLDVILVDQVANFIATSPSRTALSIAQTVPDIPMALVEKAEAMTKESINEIVNMAGVSFAKAEQAYLEYDTIDDAVGFLTSP